MTHKRIFLTMKYRERNEQVSVVCDGADDGATVNVNTKTKDEQRN